MRIEGLGVKGARSAADQYGLPDKAPNGESGAAVVDRRRRAEGLQRKRTACGGRRRACRSGVSDRGRDVAHADRLPVDEGVVERRHTDHVRAKSGCARRVEPHRAVVADRRHDDHPVFGHEPVGGDGRRVGRPLERGADAHVQDVHAVGERPLHRGEHDRGRRRALAAEDAVRAEADAGRDARDNALRADDPRDVRPVTVAVVGIGIRHRDRGIRERCRVGVEVVAHEVPSREHAGRSTHRDLDCRSRFPCP